MVERSADDLTDALLDACHHYDSKRVIKALSDGAQVNRLSRAGLLPVHVLIDPGAPHSDKKQSKCLRAMLDHRVNLIAKHRGAYSVYERISFLLPECAKVLIEHHRGLPGAVKKMDEESIQWWSALAGKWQAIQDAETLSSCTISSANASEARRL